MDYRLPLLFGAFITPAAQSPQLPVHLAVTADQAGLDLVTFQDHPYQPRFLDTWTLMTYVAALTQRVHISANVHNLPLRPPAVLARAGASLDLLSGGRFEMAIGAGGFTDAIVAMGGPRRSPGQSRRAVEEAIEIMREMWDTEQRGGVRVRGEIYAVDGAKRGPAPAHRIGISVGAYKPRMLDLVGRLCDGWLPSLGYLPGGTDDLPALNAQIDEAAHAAGRPPEAIRRFLNLSGTFADSRQGLLHGPPHTWAEDLTALAVDHGISGFVFATDDADTIERIGTQVAPLTREMVSEART